MTGPLARTQARQRALRGGRWAEWAAAAYLMLKGYRILARRFGGKGGEIDLIARRGETIIFVEVKARADLGLAEIAITPAKRLFMARAARRWLALHPRAVSYVLRADAVFVAPWRRPRHVPGIFPLD